MLEPPKGVRSCGAWNYQRYRMLKSACNGLALRAGNLYNSY